MRISRRETREGLAVDSRHESFISKGGVAFLWHIFGVGDVLFPIGLFVAFGHRIYDVAFAGLYAFGVVGAG